MPATNEPVIPNVIAHQHQMRRGIFLLNPAFMYAATWMSILVLYALGLSDLLEPLRTATIVLVVGSSLAFIVGWAIESLPHSRRLANLQLNLEVLGGTINSAYVRQRLKTAWIILGLGISFEVAYFGGAPGLGLIGVGPDILYTEFGLPGVHGFLNAIFYACCVVQFARIQLGSSKKTYLLTLFSVGYPVFCMSRQILISLLLQYVLIYFSFNRPSLKIFVRTGTVFVAVFLIFGYLGDLRSGRESIISLAAPTFEYPDWLPSAFIWFYIYLCTPLNNVNFNINITPNYLPLETIGSFIPSFARDSFLNAAGSTQQWTLVADPFNVSSVLQSLLTDFGISGTIVFTLLCGIGFSLLMRRSTSRPAAFFSIIVFLHGIALSFFVNLMFHLVFMSEILIVSWIVARRHSP